MFSSILYKVAYIRLLLIIKKLINKGKAILVRVEYKDKVSFIFSLISPFPNNFILFTLCFKILFFLSSFKLIRFLQFNLPLEI